LFDKFEPIVGVERFLFVTRERSTLAIVFLLSLLHLGGCNTGFDTASPDRIRFNTTPPKVTFPGEKSSDWKIWDGISDSKDVLKFRKIVKLQLTNESVIGRISDVERVDGNWYVLDDSRRIVLSFSAEGAFLGMIGARGQGPGEYEWPGLLSRWGEDLVIIDQRRSQLLLFHHDGQFHKSFSTANLRITLRADIVIFNERLFVADFAARNVRTPWHVILDVSQPEWRTLWGFGHRFAYPIEHPDIRPFTFTAFSRVGDRIWTGSPYSSEVEVYDLDGHLLGNLEPGLDGLKEEDLIGKSQMDFNLAMSAKPTNYEILSLDPFVLVFFRTGRMSVFENKGHLVKANLKVNALQYIVPKAIDGTLVTVVDFGFQDMGYLENALSDADWELLLQSGFNPDDRENDNPYLVVSTLPDLEGSN